jgi:hypothetical protein
MKSATNRIDAQKSRGLEVNGLEIMIPKVDVGGGSWRWAREDEDKERMSVRRAGIRLPVTSGGQASEIGSGNFSGGKWHIPPTSFEWLSYKIEVAIIEMNVMKPSMTGKSILHRANVSDLRWK